MTLPDLQKQALQLSISDRWQLVHTLLESLQQETHLGLNKADLSRLRGIAKAPGSLGGEEMPADYATYLTQKYQ